MHGSEALVVSGTKCDTGLLREELHNIELPKRSRMMYRLLAIIVLVHRGETLTRPQARDRLAAKGSCLRHHSTRGAHLSSHPLRADALSAAALAFGCLALHRGCAARPGRTARLR